MSTSRHFQNDFPPFKTVNAHEELLASLTRITTYNPPVQTYSTGWTFSGLYSGPTSIAFLFYRLAITYPKLAFRDQRLIDWAVAYFEVGVHEKPAHADSNHCGIGDETLARLALQTALYKDSSLAQKLCAYAKVINSTETPGSNEWLYGRAGYLYLLRLARSAFDYTGDDATTVQLIQRTLQATVQRILDSPKPWIWHGKQYLGAVHGTIGIIYQLMRSSPSSASTVSPMLQQVLQTQYPSGNFPSSLPAGHDRLLQFCHGSPGIVMCLRELQPYFPNLAAEIAEAIALAEGDVWKRGLLTKDPCLCHGIASNALALYPTQQFEHFLSWMSSASLEENNWLDEAGYTDTFPGLFIGEAGRAWVWAVADRYLPRTCIGFNDV